MFLKIVYEKNVNMVYHIDTVIWILLISYIKFKLFDYFQSQWTSLALAICFAFIINIKLKLFLPNI